ncbi:MAG: TetR/AcrR family transcriptional regulator [Rhizobiaceae bacterium]|nr:TetR/AcrR family transcriptional regulator [Rhizobiaceae bacterium]
MDVSRQLPADAGVQRGPRYRTRRLMLEAATRLMQSGANPSVTDVAEAAGVSRATAYRYFPSQAALVHAVVDQALGPILEWSSDSRSVETRVADLFAMAMPRIQDFEATFKAALRLSLEQWAHRQAGTQAMEPQFTRGHRIELLMDAVAPARGQLSRGEQERLAQALSLVFGVEALVVLGDIWGLDRTRVGEVVAWASEALVKAAMQQGKGGSKD